jgi:transposase-like protein
MLGCALIVERQLRAMSKVGIRDVAESLRAQRANAQRMRDKFTRER